MQFRQLDPKPCCTVRLWRRWNREPGRNRPHCATAGWVSSRTCRAATPVAGSTSLVTWTVGKANLMPLASNAAVRQNVQTGKPVDLESRFDPAGRVVVASSRPVDEKSKTTSERK